MPWTPAQVALLQRNDALVEIRRLFEVWFDGEPFRLIEDTVARQAGGAWYMPAFPWLTGGRVERGGSFVSNPVEYRVTAFTASPTDDAAAAFAALCVAALHDVAAWQDAPISQLLQLYENGVPAGPPTVLHKGYIFDVQPSETMTEGYITITAHDVFSRRNWTPLGEYTDRARKAAYPGDRGAEFVASLRNKRITGWMKG